MKGYRKYFLNKLGWLAITFVFAFLLNFILPRLMPGDPVAAIVARQAQGMLRARDATRTAQSGELSTGSHTLAMWGVDRSSRIAMSGTNL